MIDVCLMERFEKGSTNEYLLIFYIQPAVSRQIRLLEDDLGITLFERERHGMSLTEPGKALVEYGRRIMLEIDRARTELQGAEAGEVDATLLYGAERSAEIRTVPLVDEPLWVVGPRGSGLQPGKPVPLSIVSGWKLILPIAVADDLAQGRLVGAPISDPGITRTIVLALPANRSTGRHIRGVVDILVEEMHRVIKAGGWPEGHWLADEKPGQPDGLVSVRPTSTALGTPALILNLHSH